MALNNHDQLAQLKTNGGAAASLIALSLGLWGLLLSHHASVQVKAAEKAIYNLGSWIPGALGTGPGGSIGPYSGKEVIMVLCWALSWIVCHALLKDSEVNLRNQAKFFLINLVVVTALFLHPIADPIFSVLFAGLK